MLCPGIGGSQGAIRRGEGNPRLQPSPDERSGRQLARLLAHAHMDTILKATTLRAAFKIVVFSGVKTTLCLPGGYAPRTPQMRGVLAVTVSPGREALKDLRSRATRSSLRSPRGYCCHWAVAGVREGEAEAAVGFGLSHRGLAEPPWSVGGRGGRQRTPRSPRCWGQPGWACGYSWAGKLLVLVVGGRRGVAVGEAVEEAGAGPGHSAEAATEHADQRIF